MIHKVAVVGAGIIGMTNAIGLLLQNKNRNEIIYDVIIFTKEDPLHTNSDAAVATWFAPNDDKPLLQKYCLESLVKFDELINNKTPGVDKIQQTLFFENKKHFENSVWAKASTRKLVQLREIPQAELETKDNLPAVRVTIPLINPRFYRPHMLEHFKALGGKLEYEEIASLSNLTKSYPIVINSTGWEAKYLTSDDSVYPVRGQTETFDTPLEFSKGSINVEHLTMYVVYRPAKLGNGDCVVGTTYQEHDTNREVRTSDKQDIISRVSTFFPMVKNVTTVSKVGIRCGRPEVRIEKEKVGESMIVHCYGHGGSGYSASWGSANKVLEYCNGFVNERTQQSIPKI